MRAYIVVDLGFGDCGKGLLTDFLARNVKAGVVVRYNGGAQAGHNVVTPDGSHHTFSQFGSGSFLPGVKTFLSKHVVIHPTALLMEGELLERKDIRDIFSRLRLSEQALVITPFHQAANRIRELARGANRHGSCGVGVGEAMEDAISNADYRVTAGDLIRPAQLRRKLRIIREHKHEQILSLKDELAAGSVSAREWQIFEEDDVIDAWITSVARIGELGLIASDSILEQWMQETPGVIFEGAQGVLLDAEFGFHPYTTWSRCTAANALELINEAAPGSDVHQIGVLRSYAVRHGPGPLPTEVQSFSRTLVEHNAYNEWQGHVRYGWFDAVLTRYALSATGSVDSLMVTHLDAMENLESWKYCPRYEIPNGLHGVLWDPHNPDEAGVAETLPFTDHLSIAERTEFTRSLSAVSPILETCESDGEKVIQKVEELLGQQVGLVSRGTSASDVQVLHPIPT